MLVVGSINGGKMGLNGGGAPFLFLLLLLSFGNGVIPFNLSNLFLISNSLPGSLGKFLVKSLSVPFLKKSSSLSKESTMGFSASNVETSSNTSSKGFRLQRIFLLIASNFCLKLALLMQSLVT